MSHKLTICTILKYYWTTCLNLSPVLQLLQCLSVWACRVIPQMSVDWCHHLVALRGVRQRQVCVYPRMLLVVVTAYGLLWVTTRFASIIRCVLCKPRTLMNGLHGVCRDCVSGLSLFIVLFRYCLYNSLLESLLP